MALPTQTDEQRKAALGRATEVRRYRAQVKKSLKNGTTSLLDVFDDEECRRMRVSELLRALPGIGEASTEAIMTDLGISEGRRIKGLGARQRRELLARFQ